MPLEIEHLYPYALGGSSTRENLWLACTRCNDFKGDRIEAGDPATDEQVKLFDPRRQQWIQHFAWSLDGVLIIGRSPVGRATVAALRLNNEYIVATRRIWVAATWWPLVEDMTMENVEQAPTE